MALKDWRRMKTHSPKWESKNKNHHGGKNRIELEKTGSILGGERWFTLLIRLNSSGFPEGYGSKDLLTTKGGTQFKKHAIMDAKQYMKHHSL